MPKKILVIDDEPSLRTLIVEILCIEQYETVAAENGLDGIEAARLHRPDLIVCDVTMPGMNGHGVLSTLREDPLTAGIPFIFLTGKGDSGDIRQGMKLGADDYLLKPISREELLDAIKVRLAKHNTLSKLYEQKLEHLRKTISSSLPHELRTPLNGILGLTELILESQDSLGRDEVFQMVRNIHESANRLHRLVENFWFFARLEILATDPEKLAGLRAATTYSAVEIVTAAARKAARQANRSDDLVLDVEEASCHIAENYLAKLVFEVLDNAFKYSNAGSPVILTGRSGATYHIEICDRGRGLTPEQIADVGAYMQFDRGFYEQQGAGLGLTIAKRLAEIHDGDLKIDSTPEVLTKILISLPRA